MAARARLLYGRSPTVSRQLALLAVGLFGLTVAVFYTDVNTLWPFPLAASGAVLLVGLAAAATYYNEGLLVAWLLTFAVALPAFVFYPPRGPTFAVTPASAPVAVATAAGVTLGLAAVGAAIGVTARRRRERADTNRYEPSPTVLPTLFVGRDGRQATTWLLAATAEFVGVFAGVWTGVLPFGFGLGGELGVTVLLVLMAGPATVYAVRNSGLLVCWALAFAPLFGVFLALQLGATFEPAPSRPVLFALGSAALFSSPVGTVGFLLGVTTRRVRHYLRSPSEPAVSLD
jgi:hypothetical protein